MVDQISVTGDQCAALPQGHKHDCDRFDKEPKSVWQLNTNRCLATMWMLNQRYRVWHQGVLPWCFSPITYHRAESKVIRGSGRNIESKAKSCSLQSSPLLMQCCTKSSDFLKANYESLLKNRLCDWIIEISVSNRAVLTEIPMTIWFTIAGKDNSCIIIYIFFKKNTKSLPTVYNTVGGDISAALHYFIIMPSFHFTCVKHKKKTALRFGYCTQTYCNFDKKFNPCSKLKKNFPKQPANHNNGCQLISRAKNHACIPLAD